MGGHVMTAPLLLFRVGWMDAYDGPAPIVGGGSHVVENGTGGEMWNFAPVGGRCFGYVMSRYFAGLDLGRIAAREGGDWEEGDELPGVDVGFFARSGPGAPQVIVGCYLGATVFHRAYRRRPDPASGGDPIEYLCEVDEDDAFLLAPAERHWTVPYAPVDGRGYPGQSNVWYGGDATPAAAALTAKARTYLGSLRGRRPAGPGGRMPPDQDLIRAIEDRSMKAVRRHFRSLGYEVRFVHRDNVGWDMTATREGEELQLEVKGHLGEVVHFELSPNEYATMRARAATYRVCLVRNALARDEVEVLVPIHEGNGAWRLRGDGVLIELAERVGAKASQVA